MSKNLLDYIGVFSVASVVGAMLAAVASSIVAFKSAQRRMQASESDERALLQIRAAKKAEQKDPEIRCQV